MVGIRKYETPEQFFKDMNLMTFPSLLVYENCFKNLKSYDGIEMFK